MKKWLHNSMVSFVVVGVFVPFSLLLTGAFLLDKLTGRARDIENEIRALN